MTQVKKLEEEIKSQVERFKAELKRQTDPLKATIEKMQREGVACELFALRAASFAA